LTIPNSVTSIGHYAFWGCSGLMGPLTIPNSVNSIGYGAFWDCSGLTGTLGIPDFVTSIGNSAFRGCSGFTGTLTIPNSITSIGENAFYGCSGLTSITIPNSVTFIDILAFGSCSGLTNVVLEDGTTNLYFAGYYSNQAFANCPIESLYLGKNISYYDIYSPFSNKTTLKLLTIGNSVASISDFAFYGCSELIEIHSENPTPPQVEESYTFYGVNKEACTLYVPAGCASIYASRPVWKDFFNIQETSINNIVSDSDISVSIISEGIKITGCNPIDKVSLYTVNGQLVLL